MHTIRIGLVGTGFAGRFHLECLRRAYGAHIEITGVTSLTPRSREAFGKTHGIPVYPDLDALLPHVDVLDICSPPAAHGGAVLAAARAGKHIICEKPFSGYFGPDGCGEEYFGNRDPKEKMLDTVCERLGELARAIRTGGGVFGYAENFVYAPAIQKEREVVEKTGAQILRMIGEESHNGSASPLYGIWRHQGGGSLMGKICHPLGAVLYLKQVEGLARNGHPIRPKSVSCRCEEITKLPAYADRGFIRTGYHDAEDHGWMHVTFSDGTIADVLAGEIVLGGIYNYVEVFANNHRTRCNLSPVGVLETFNPSGPQYRDIYTVEKISTKEGWTTVSPDENFTLGYQAEIQDFVDCIVAGRDPQSGLGMALDTITSIYAAYLSNERKGQETAIPLL